MKKTLLSVLTLSAAACTHDIAEFDRVDVKTARSLDILYVFDNSIDNSSWDEMASQLDVLQQKLTAIDGQLPSLHVGVTTADLGLKGTEDAGAPPPLRNCNGNGDGGRLLRFGASITADYLEDLRAPGGQRQRNYTGALGDELAALTNPITATGCEISQPLEAMRRALDPATNPGFVRDDAQLMVVFLTTEDDCSAKTSALFDPNNPALGPSLAFRCTEQGVVCDPDDPRTPGRKVGCRPREGSPFMVDVSEYQSFLTALKPGPGDVTISAAAGPRGDFLVEDFGVPVLLPSCRGPSGVARPAVRLGALVDAFGGGLADACTQADAYGQVSQPYVRAQRSCFPNLLQTDGNNCRVIETIDDTSTTLSPCGPGVSAPCWNLYTDAAECPGGDNVGISIDRGRTAAPETSSIQATCFVDRRE
ncbi:MAG: hypothetical protein KF773_14540 [Deltaproteobacteria bacterium]|nr:hypothetical protein [Deltaproteobacteria bacterium]